MAMPPFFYSLLSVFLLHSGKEHLNISTVNKEPEQDPAEMRPSLYSDTGRTCLRKSAPIFLTCSTKLQQLSEQKADPPPLSEVWH